MANQNNTLWIVLVLVILGIAALILSATPKSTPTNQVVMKDVFTQNTPASIKSSELQKDPVPSPAIVTSPEGGKEAGFAVQVYSFKDQQRADKALENLKNNGFDKAYIEISDLGSKGTWYRVRIGGLQNDTQAKAMLENVRKNFNSAIIVKSK